MEEHHPITRYSRVLAAATAALATAVVVGASSSAQTPPIPTPPIPNPPPVKIPGEKVEKFKLVFDGTSHADRIDDIGGQTAGCDAQLHADVQEDVTFGRGKGVTMEFVRFKEGKHFRYGFQRSGRKLESSFNVVAKVHRTATGQGELTQHPNSTQCPIQQFSAGQNADCGKTKTENDAWGLTVKNDHFRPAPANPLVGNGNNHCGEPPPGSAFSGDIAELVYEWPTPPTFIFEPIPLHKMFNDRFKRIAVHFKTLNAETRGQVNGILTETTTDRGNAEATVRFIRQP